MRILASSLVAILIAGSVAAQDARDLEPPRRLEAAGRPIDVTTGHAAPYVYDFDGDGVRDLLVGEYGVGSFPKERLPENRRDQDFEVSKLRIYRNLGTDSAPRFEGFKYLEAGGAHASIPST